MATGNVSIVTSAWIVTIGEANMANLPSPPPPRAGMGVGLEAASVGREALAEYAKKLKIHFPL